MAIIQSIRNRAGVLLAVVVGVALFAFILGDFITSGGQIIRGKRMNVAEINGEGIPYPTFEKMINEMEEITKMQYGTKNLDENTTLTIRTQAWQSLLQDKIFSREYEKLGLAIHGDELFDMVQGQNPHPIIMQLFGNPETGVINRSGLNNFLLKIKDADPQSDEKRYWLYIEDMIFKQRMFEKYNSLVRHGLYATNLDAEKRKNEMSNTVDFNYVVKSYSLISDSAVSVSSSEIKDYYKEHKQEYKQEESRSIKYVEFKVNPSKSDNADAEKWINEAQNEFTQITDDEQYIKVNSDIEYNPTNYKKGELPAQLDEFMFNAQIGSIYGPYFEENTYKLAKLSKINFLPDSVHISQIVLPANQQNAKQMQYLSDSLKTLAESGADFAELARTNSKDQSALQGGDIGWIKEGTFGKHFSDSCFYASKGDIKITYSQSGIHIVKIIAQSQVVKKVQVGILARIVTASEKTDQYYYSIASEFAGKNNTGAKFEEAVKSNSPAAIPVFNLKSSDNSIQNLDRSRPLVKWAFEAKNGDVSTVYRFGDSYVVATLVKTSHEGYTPVEELTASIEPILKKQKKAEIIKKEFASTAVGASSIDAIANKLQLQVQSASNVKFTSYALPGMGQEPRVIAAALNIGVNKLSAPIDGENGVYIINLDKQPVSENQGMNIDLAKSYIDRGFGAKVNYKSFDVLKELAKVKDYRTRFF
jgi:peptidyl-prolyl cis-trans isomerase D